MSTIKFNRDFCKWCGRYQFLMPKAIDPNGVCGCCIEDSDYLDVQASNKRIERMAAKRKGK